MQITISLAVGAVALFVIMSKKFVPKDKHWVCGAVETIIGFWLRS